MYYEKLALEVNASTAGLGVMKPPVLSGASGVEHRFSFMAADGAQMYGIDIYKEVEEVEVLRTYVKKLDTGAACFLVCLSGRPSPEARELASKYEMQILGPGEIENLFSRKLLPVAEPVRQVGGLT